MATVTLAALIIGNILLGIGLGFWHRCLMIRLYTDHPDVWRCLGRQDFTGRWWHLSKQLPLWSWGSLLFFIAKRYQTIGDAVFSERAAKFRAALIVWLIEVCVAGALNMYWGNSST